MIDVNGIRQRAKQLVEKMNIAKTTLGRVLGGKTGEDPRVCINRASRFLSGAQKKISLDQVNALAEFFEKPIDWFLFGTAASQDSTILASSAKQSSHTHKPLSEIRKNLRKMGFEKEYIETLITQLQAMEAYNARKGKK